jgi:hypothetical protein
MANSDVILHDENDPFAAGFGHGKRRQPQGLFFSAECHGNHIWSSARNDDGGNLDDAKRSVKECYPPVPRKALTATPLLRLETVPLAANSDDVARRLRILVELLPKPGDVSVDRTDAGEGLVNGKPTVFAKRVGDCPRK